MPNSGSSSEQPTTKICIYCGRDKPENDFSEEHIWPDALGGDFLPPLWQTHDVCRQCNNMSGIFVDGAFIKSFVTSNERAFDGLDYLNPNEPTGILPLNYLGTIEGIAKQEGEAADFWVCSPGANIIHFRKESEDWSAYAGGDPRNQSKPPKAGRVLVSLTSDELYWICTALSSVKHHFAKAEKFVTNCQLPPAAKHFREPDPSDSQQAADLEFLKKFEATSEGRTLLQTRITLAPDANGRFLSKVALGIGYSLFGEAFLQTADGRYLRMAFREADPQKRQKIPVRGSAYPLDDHLGEQLRWPGGWVLSLLRLPDVLALRVQSPSGRTMTIQVTDDSLLLEKLDPTYRGGIVWLTVPPVGRAVGPIPYEDYIAHQVGYAKHPELAELEALRGQKNGLPPTGISSEKQAQEAPRIEGVDPGI